MSFTLRSRELIRGTRRRLGAALSIVCRRHFPSVPAYPVHDRVDQDFCVPTGYGQRFTPADRFMVIAHRGARLDAPENSIRAIELALQQGATVSEIDLRLSCDGVPIVQHDAAFDAGEGKRVEDMTSRELREKGVASLEDVFQNVPDLGYFLDTLVVDRRLIERTLELVMDYGMQDKVMLLGRYAYLDAHRYWKMPRGGLSDRLKSEDSTGRRLIQKAKDDGRIVFAIAKEGDSERMRILLEMGIDGVMTADIRTLVDTVSAYTERV